MTSTTPAQHTSTTDTSMRHRSHRGTQHLALVGKEHRSSSVIGRRWCAVGWSIAGCPFPTHRLPCLTARLALVDTEATASTAGIPSADCSSCGGCPASSCTVRGVPAPANPLYSHHPPHPIGRPTICRLHHTTSQQHKVACVQLVPRTNASNRSHKCIIFSPSPHRPLSSAIRPCHASLGSH
ncbi:hypothetical protein CMEL01_15221 [Colletotrichum melonis]|uniref:Uncharacterized protein n=1 Tax=Colletotrichum melonis TaxID=1209925 RepID=A0AAI9URS9_9PEZI|nr:hypothetical protein CMEL01_15221 [Colletotrichum melonis]